MQNKVTLERNKIILHRNIMSGTETSEEGSDSIKGTGYYLLIFVLPN